VVARGLNVDEVYRLVGERSVVVGSVSVSRRGRGRSENVGLSSEKMGENPIPRKSKGFPTRLVRGELVGT
jgi:hypothetical protein